MKSIQNLFFFALIVMVCSCGKNDYGPLSDWQNIPEVSTRTIPNQIYNIPIYSPTQLVVQYAPGTTPATKSFLRTKHNVLSFEVCALCPDESIEKWFFDNTIGIEPRKKAIETFGGGVLFADFEFTFTSELGDIIPGSSDDTTYVPLIAPANSGVTIAILDTGFDPFFPFWYESGEPISLLYNASETAEGDEISGYDFVNYDNNPFDDHSGKHGTVIAKIFNDVLNSYGAQHQILPIKVCNELGEASYFQLVCGLNYAMARTDVLQMSLGWYDDGFGDFENTIFKNILETYNNVIVVTSAGNGFEDGTINDNDTLAHYPSSYDVPNLIAVAATNELGTAAAEFSNFGEESVDFWAGGQGITFYDYDYIPLPEALEGTSFAAPQIAALAAKYRYFDSDISPEAVIDSLDINGLIVPGAYSGMVKYDKFYHLLVD